MSADLPTSDWIVNSARRSYDHTSLLDGWLVGLFVHSFDMLVVNISLKDIKENVKWVFFSEHSVEWGN